MAGFYRVERLYQTEAILRIEAESLSVPDTQSNLVQWDSWESCTKEIGDM